MDRIFKYNIAEEPVTLDPQQADDSISNMVIKNVFLGLIKVNSDGELENGAASEFTVSDDGLVYNFKLREDIYWTSANKFSSPCKARDFVYGFKRLFLSETEAARAPEYYCIKNSRSFHENGGLYPGVVAKGDYELEITLEYPDPRFLSLLAEPPAMPCCEEFFLDAQGKYGLSAKCTPSNGAFYVRSWTDENGLALTRNSLNAEALGVCPSGLNFYVKDANVHVKEFNAGNTQCIAVSNDDKGHIEGKYNCAEFGSISVGLVFNSEFSLFQNEKFRKAMTLLADRETIGAAIPEFKAAGGIVPDQVSVGGRNYRETVGECALPEYDPQRAGELFREVRSELDADLFTSARVIVRSAAARTAASYILQEWQREFGFYCTVETLNEADFESRLKKGTYEIAVVELSGKYNSPAAYLEQFLTDSIYNYGRFTDEYYEILYKRASESADALESEKLFKAAEQYLIDKSAFLPLFGKNEYFFTPLKSSDIVYDPFSKTIDFSKAKMR